MHAGASMPMISMFSYENIFGSLWNDGVKFSKSRKLSCPSVAKRGTDIGLSENL